MAEEHKYTAGTFCWTDLATTSVDGAKEFYKVLFPWDYTDDPMPEGGSYTMINKGEASVGGLFELSPEMAQMGAPPNWTSYVSVADAEATAAKIKELGGQLIKEPFDVMEAGRMAVCADPTGAVFALWQPKQHQGAAPGDFSPGTRCWNELVSRDTAKSKEFFSALFGWEATEQQMGPMTYTMFKLGEEQVAGMMAVSPEMGEMPSAWIVYMIVDGVNERVAKAVEAGGMALMPPQDIPEVGRITWLKDPQGAVLGILEPAASE